MPGRPRRPAVLAVLLALAALGPALAGAQAVVSPELRAETARLFRELARLRGLPAGRPPPVVVRTRDERRRFIASELRRKYSPARLDAERRALVAWGLVPPAFDLAGFVTDLVLEQAAAYYDPVGKVMVLANWLPPDERREALAHELVHALQDRAIGLDRFLTAAPGKSDEALARQALVEGEAVALALDRSLRARGQDLAALPDVEAERRAIVASATGPTLSRAPRYLKAVLTFPYAQGLVFVHAFRRRSAWPALAAVYADPPRSTSQVLHPERYLDRREDPVRVSLPDLASALGAGARVVIEDELGEFALGQVLEEHAAQTPALSRWRGDRYALWELPGGSPVLVALSAWEDAEAARELASAYARVVARKHALEPDALLPGRARVQDTGAFLVEPRGRELLVLERVPAPAVDLVRDLVWASRPASAAPRPRGRPAPVLYSLPDHAFDAVQAARARPQPARRPGLRG